MENNQVNEQSKKKNGCTLFVNNNESSESLNFNNYEGLLSHVETKPHTYFLKFDTPDNSLVAFNKLQEKNVLVKFSYYRVFFTLEGLLNDDNYTQVKTQLMEWVKTNALTNVLYLKFYHKNDKYLGCGDLTVDSLDGLNKLLSKDNGLKHFEFDSYKGSFYRFNNKNTHV